MSTDPIRDLPPPIELLLLDLRAALGEGWPDGDRIGLDRDEVLELVRRIDAARAVAGTQATHPDGEGWQGRCPVCLRRRCTWHGTGHCAVGEPAPRYQRYRRRPGPDTPDPSPPRSRDPAASGEGPRLLRDVQAVLSGGGRTDFHVILDQAEVAHLLLRLDRALDLPAPSSPAGPADPSLATRGWIPPGSIEDLEARCRELTARAEELGRQGRDRAVAFDARIRVLAGALARLNQLHEAVLADHARRLVALERHQVLEHPEPSEGHDS